MSSFPPQLIALFCIMFIALGIFNILMARRRQRDGRTPTLPWYKQVGILTGIEYILLASVFLINIGITYRVLPSSLNGIIFPFFIVLLLASGLLAGFVIYQGLSNARNRRRPATSVVQSSIGGNTRASSVIQEPARDLTPEEREQYSQRRRERRKKAASARRRQAGKA